MRCIFMIASEYGLKCLNKIRQNNIVEIVGIITTHKNFILHYGDSQKEMRNLVYDEIFKMKCEIPIFEIEKMNDKATISMIEKWKPDLIIVSGWYHMIGKKILQLPKLGVVGLHASLLPKYRGGAPLVWQMINGEKYAGISLFYFDEGVDSGDIIAQKKVKIYSDDTILTLYERVGNEGIILLKQSLKELSEGIIRRRQQIVSDEDIYPQRKPEDGLINWNTSAEQVYNFIRAQTKPYPGAFTMFNDKKIFVWRSKIKEVETVNNKQYLPGEIISTNKGNIVIAVGNNEMIEIDDYEFEDKMSSQLIREGDFWG